MIACVCLTVRDCAAPILGYLNEESYSIISVEYNDTVQSVRASFCIEMDTSKVSIRNLTALEDDVTLTAFFTCLQNQDCIKTNVFDRFADQIFAAAKILSKFYVLENGEQDQVDVSNASVAGIPDSFHRYLIGEKNLTKSIGFILCSKMEISVKHYTQKGKANIWSICSAAELIWFGMPPRTPDGIDLLCYNVENFTKFHSMDERYEISFFPHNLPTDQDQPLDADFAYLSVDETPITISETSNYVTIRFDECIYVELDLAMRISLLSTKRRPCETERTNFECYGRCSVLELARTCSCLPVSWELYTARGLDQSIANVSCLSRYSGAMHEFERCVREAHDERENCTRNCLRLCEKNVVNFVQTTCELQLQQTKRTTIVYALHRPFYTYVEERRTFEASTVFSNVGGVVGLWLGAGFIGILEAVLFLPKVTAEYAGLSRTTKSKARLSEVMHRLECLEAEMVILKANRATKGEETSDEVSPNHPQVDVQF